MALPEESSTFSPSAPSQAEPGPEPASGSFPNADDSVTLSFRSIIKLVPTELHGKLGASGVGGVSFSISKTQILEQLRHGSVKVSFGELRQAAPVGVFVSNSNQDSKLIELPLGEIMRQMRGTAFVRRSSQKRLELSGDIADIFGQKGEPLAQVRVMEKKEVSKSAPLTSQSVAVADEAEAPVVSSRGSPATPAAPPAAPIRMATAVRAAASGPAPSPVAPIRMTAPPATFRPTSVPSKPSAPTVSAPPKAAAKTPKKATAPAAASASSSSEPSLVVSLGAIADNWPDVIRAEISELGLSNATCELPLAEIGSSLRTGKVQCRWKQIRSWIQPPNHTTTTHGNTVLDLPLKVLAPLYVEHCRNTRSPKKASAAENIPDVFAKAGKPALPTPPAAAAEPAPSPLTAPSASEPEPEEVAVEAAPEAAAPVSRPPFLSLPVSLVFESWPDQVRKEVDSFNLTDAKLELPYDMIEEGLKQGRLSFRWRQVCLWLNPPPPPEMASANLNTQIDYRVDLPLNFIAPLYLQHRTAAAPRKSGVPDSIPNLFGPGTQNATQAPIPGPGPAISSAPPPPRSAPDKGAKKSGEELAELFGEPAKRNWTPNDIVHKTATLPGVAGALIALQDGLLVASCMPPNWKTETIAAFLPQIFGRMRQYTNEFKMGELRSIAFTVEEGTLQVFNAGIIYFAALAQGDAVLPMSDLSLIVREIGRHTK